MTTGSLRKTGTPWEFAPVLSVALLALGLATFLTWQVAELGRATDAVDRADQTMGQIHRVSEVLISLQSGVRGHVITQDPALLSRFETARQAVAPALERLDVLTRDDPEQSTRAHLIREQLGAWISYAETALERSHDGQAPGEALRELSAARWMPKLRATLEQMNQIELGTRDQLASVARRHFATTRSLAVGAVLMLAFFLGFALVQRGRFHAQSVRASERLRALTAQLTEYAVYLLEPDGRVASWNEGARRLMGYGADEVLGRSFALFFFPEDRDAHAPERALAQAADHGHFTSQGWRVRKDGTRFWADSVLTALRDKEGRLSGFAKVTRDLTAQRRRQLQERLLGEIGHTLARSLDFETVFRMVAELVVPALADWTMVHLQLEGESAPRLVAVVHGDPDKREAVRRFEREYRPAAEEEEGVRRVIATGQPVLVGEVSEEALARLARDPESAALTRELGARAYLIVPLQARGRTFGTLSMIAADRLLTGEDLQVATEIAQRAALVGDNARLFQQATEAVQRRDELMAILSHDLRNPMHAIRINAHVLRLKVAQLSADPAQRTTLERLASSIESAVEQGDRLINDLLETSRLESGTFTVSLVPTGLCEVVERAMSLFRPIAEEKGLTLTTEVGPETIRCDPERVLEVLSNLLANAIRHTEGGGQVTVLAEPDGDWLRVGVRDTGSGISPEALPHVFDRYWQASRTRRAGAGLGLSIAQGIVTAHGGRIWAESTEGRGSTFWFTLPRGVGIPLVDAAPPAAT